MNVNAKCNSQMTCLTVLCGPISHFIKVRRNELLTQHSQYLPRPFLFRLSEIGEPPHPPLAPVARGFLHLVKFSSPPPYTTHLLCCSGSEELPVTLHEGPDPWSQGASRSGVGLENSLYLSGRVSSVPDTFLETWNKNTTKRFNPKHYSISW
jgi:hypothetical protein